MGELQLEKLIEAVNRVASELQKVHERIEESRLTFYRLMRGQQVPGEGCVLVEIRDELRELRKQMQEQEL